MTDITGRDNYIISQALFVATKALRTQKHPPWSDIEDMERILRERFGAFLEGLEMNNDLGRAWRLGFRPKESVTHDEIKAWLAENAPDENVIALYEKPSDS